MELGPRRHPAPHGAFLRKTPYHWYSRAPFATMGPQLHTCHLDDLFAPTRPLGKAYLAPEKKGVHGDRTHCHAQRHRSDEGRAVRPLSAVRAVPAHRVGRGRRARRCRQPGLDAAARPVRQPTAPSSPGPATPAPRPPIASALRGWNHLRFEITEEPTASSEGARYSYTPGLGVFHAVTGLHGDIMIPEDRLKAAVVKAALGDTTLLIEIDKLLGKPWDDELETFRHAGEGAPVRWLHQVV